MARRSRLGGQLEAAPRNWWMKSLPRRTAGKVCMRTKTDALNAFRQYNQAVIDAYGGAGAVHRPSEFDAINHKYDLRGKRRVKTIAGALWQSLRGKGPPWCIEDIDLDVLNETTPGQHGPGFQLPGAVMDHVIEQQAERRYEEDAIDEGLITDCHTRFRSKKRGQYRKDGKRLPGRGEVRERACVCRDDRGRFTQCDTGGGSNDVPF